MLIHDATLFVYNLALLPIIFLSVLFLILSLVSLFVDKKPAKKEFSEYPSVSIQIPVYNDPIALRCVEHCLKQQYPKEFQIMIVDDSTDEKTQLLLKEISEKHKNITYVHRDNRVGYKPGALNHAYNLTKGEIIVIFDADWMPQPDFLKNIVQPFADPEIAIVQARQGFYNKDTNLISRFAAYTLMVYHTIIMPIHRKCNSVFFCGTAGAIRKKALEAVGGWNYESITEDSDLSLKMMIKGYKTTYLDIETPSEVPHTFEGFIKQQMRWCYGNTRVFIDNAPAIMYKKGLTLRQRIMITYVTLGNVAAPIVLFMTFFGLAGWFLGEPTLFTFSDVLLFGSRFLFTAGFLAMGVFTLVKRKRLQELPQFLLSSFAIGLILATANSVAVYKAFRGRKLHWYCTPKSANAQV